jgi:hypothetical protein
MENVKFSDLVTRYGNVSAYDLLLSVEKLAKIGCESILSDEETRFQRALEALNQINFAE